MPKAKPAAKPSKPLITCAQCQRTFKAPQGLSAHLRHSHPNQQKIAHPTPEDAVFVEEFVRQIPSPETTDPKSYVEQAIVSLTRQAEETRQRIPLLQSELERMKQNETETKRQLDALTLARQSFDPATPAATPAASRAEKARAPEKTHAAGS